MPKLKFYCVAGRHSFTTDRYTFKRAGKRRAAVAKCPRHGSQAYRFMAG